MASRSMTKKIVKQKTNDTEKGALDQCWPGKDWGAVWKRMGRGQSTNERDVGVGCDTAPGKLLRQSELSTQRNIR